MYLPQEFHGSLQIMHIINKAGCQQIRQGANKQGRVPTNKAGCQQIRRVLALNFFGIALFYKCSAPPQNSQHGCRREMELGEVHTCGGKGSYLRPAL